MESDCHYCNKIRSLAIEYAKNAPEYSSIPLSEFFEENISDAVLEQTRGVEDNLDLGVFASSIAEVAEMKAREQEKKTHQAIAERNDVTEKLETQTQVIVDGAVGAIKDDLGIAGVVLKLIAWWPVIGTLVFVAISTLVSHLIGDASVFWIVLIPVGFAMVEKFASSKFVKRWLLKNLLPRLETILDKRIEKKLRAAELPLKDTIIQEVKNQSDLWKKCENLLKDDD